VSQARSRRFLVDANAGQLVTTALRQAGCNVFFVGDHDSRMDDLSILRLAVQEQRIIITLDADFGELGPVCKV
jgi:predicted nuclease of predicted toxin-antitoxin system